MRRRELAGWLLFSASGVVFIVMGMRNGDPLTLLSAALWMIGCALFISDGRSR